MTLRGLWDNYRVYISVVVFLCILLMGGIYFFDVPMTHASTNTWDFSSASNFSYDSLYFDVSGDAVSLKILDQTDDDNTSTGFAGGTHSDTEFSTSYIQLDATGKTNGTGSFTSRIMDVGTSTTWTSLSMTPLAAYGKELPDSNAVESTYGSVNIDMSTNFLLFHANESSGNPADASSVGHTAVYNGALHSQTGILNTGIGFDGIDDSIIVTDVDETAGATTFSFEGWFKFDTVTASDVLVSQWNNGVNQRFSLQTHTTADELIFYVPQTANTAVNFGTWLTTNADLVAGTWYHIAAVWDGSSVTEIGKLKIYKNGQAVSMTKGGTNGITAFTSTTGLEAYLGDMENVASREFTGTMDEIAFYSNALSATDVLNHYKRGALNIKYQVRTCDDNACSGENFVGPGGSTSAYYTELLNTTTSTPTFDISSDISSNQYFQYKTFLFTTNTSYTPQLSSVSVAPDHYYAGGAYVQAATTTAFAYASSLTDFNATESGGSVYYQITNEGTSSTPTWYYWDTASWTATTSVSAYNTSSTIAANIGSFSYPGDFLWRAFVYPASPTATASVSAVSVDYTGPILTSSQDPDVYVTSNLVFNDYVSATGSIKSIVDWNVAGSSVAVLNMPMEPQSTEATTALDYSDSANNGTVSGATASTTAGFDGEGAYTFDGTNDYISIAHDASLALTDDFTVTAWVKRTASNGYDGFVGKIKRNSGSPSGWTINYDTSKSRYSVYVACNGVGEIIASDPGTTASADFGWHHVAMKVSSGITYFYIDGVQQDQTTDATICDSGQAVTIGRYYSDLADHYVTGVVDEVAIWNRVLSDEQIASFASGTVDRIVAGETAVGEVWSADVTQNDGSTDVVTATSNALTVVARSSTTPVSSGHNLPKDAHWMRSTSSTLVSMTCTDEDSDTLTYAWTVDGTSVASTQSFTFDASDYTNDRHTVIGTCSDDDSNTATETIKIEVIGENDFSFAIPTNVQTHSESYPYIGAQQMQWIVDNEENLNLQFVPLAGDLVNNGSSLTQWAVLNTNLGILETANIPFAIAIGNHDYDDNLLQNNSGNRDSTNLETYFPLSDFSGESWWGGQKDAVNINTYQFLTIGGIEYMFMHVEFCPSDDTLAWANTIADTYSDKNIMVITHVNIEDDNTYVTMDESYGCGEFLDVSYVAGTDKNDGQQVWDEFTSQHDNIFLVDSAHMVDTGRGFRQDTVNNNVVSQMYHNSYQDYSGAQVTNANVAVVIFRPDENTVDVRKYDPKYDTFKTINEHEYSFGLGASSTPGTPTLTSAGETSIALSFSTGDNPSRNTYYIENTTRGTNSGWQTASTYTETGLTCATTYTYRVKSKNVFGYVTEWASANLTTSNCVAGGGGTVPASNNIPQINGRYFSINNNDLVTSQVDVSLSLELSRYVDMIAISNSADFEYTSYMPYHMGRTIPWKLLPGDGIKHVYVKVHKLDGSSLILMDSITLSGFVDTESPTGGTCPLSLGKSYKTTGDPGVYYITEDCQRRVFTKPSHYFSYFTNWNEVNITTKEILQRINVDPRGIMPWGPLYDPQYGALVKTLDDPKVYLLLNTEKYWITSEDVFNNLNYQWDWIEDVSPELLAKYKTGSEITYTDHHPNYTLVKYKHDPKVYRLEPSSTDTTKQVKRHVANETSFEQLKFRWDRIVTIPDTEVYDDGDPLT